MLNAIDCIHAIYDTTALTAHFVPGQKRLQLLFQSLGPWGALLVLSVQNCCNFTVAAPLVGLSESPNSIGSTGRQPPSHQLHGIREGSLPNASLRDTGLEARQNRQHLHRPGHAGQKTARYPRKSVGKEDLAKNLQVMRRGWLGCKVSPMMGCAGNRGL